jgi:hypothetical protein
MGKFILNNIILYYYFLLLEKNLLKYLKSNVKRDFKSTSSQMHKKWVQGLEISWEMRYSAYWDIYDEMRTHPEKTLYKIEFFKSPESNIYQFRNILFENICKILGYNIFF